MSATTIRHIHNMLHCALEAAVRKEIIARNPADAIEAPARARSEHTIFRADEIQSYLADARETASFPVYVLYVTMVGTGLREGELLGLREADVDLDRGAVLVTQTLKRAGREPRFGRPKTERSRRTVLLPVPVTSELKSLRKWKAIQKLAKGPRFHEYGLVFCGPSGKPLTANNIRYRDHAPRIARLGLRRIRLHDLRHTHASHLIAAGVDPRTVADRLGHSSPSFTLSVYAHAMPWAQERAVQAATNLLLNSRPNEAAR
jgi:integrase